MENAPLKVGDPAPDFELTDDARQQVRLSDLRGKTVMLLFYPGDFSPTCTTEHCTFGPEMPTIQGGTDAVLFGVSCDSHYCHAAFKKQYSIPYRLLADPTRKMVKAYGMWTGEEPYNSSKRGTVVIDADGNVAHYEEVSPREARKVEDLRKLVARASA